MNYETQIAQLLQAFSDDYASWNEAAGCNQLDPPQYILESGRSYDKILKVDRSQSVVGFVCKKDNPKKGFVEGDILKAASYNAPATNFIRGNIFDLEKAIDNGAIRWAGVC